MVEPGRRTKAGVGAGVVLAGVVALWAVGHDFNDGFSPGTQVQAEVTQLGDSLKVGSIVTYRDVIVGKVDDLEPSGDGGAILDLRLHTQVDAIPANVTAIAVPVDLFGASEVVLVPPRSASGQISAGTHIPANRSDAVAGLQTALADAYDLISAVRPAELSTALNALGSVLEGRGPELRDLIRRASATLSAIAPTVPHLGETLTQLATVTDQVAAEAPDLLDSVADLLVPAQELVRVQDTFRTLLGVAPTAASATATLLEATEDDIVTVITAQVPILQVMAADPDLAGSLVTGTETLARAVNSAASDGRANIQAVISGINLTGVVQTYLGQPSVVLADSADPPLYSAGDCPRYPGADGPNCNGSARTEPGVYTAASDAGHAGTTAVGPQESALTRAAAAHLLGIPVDELMPGIEALLGPLLRGSVTVLE